MNDDKKKLKIVNKFLAFGRLGSVNKMVENAMKNECKISDITKD